MLPVAFRAQTFLAGLRYPATKDQILGHARERGADEEVMFALHELPERRYETPIDLSREIGRWVSPFPGRN